MRVLYIVQGLAVFLKEIIYLLFFPVLSNERIRKIQFNKLKNTIFYAWHNIPFYRKYWTANSFHPCMFKSIQDIEKIPFIDKNIVRSYLDDFKNPNYNFKKLTLVTTGGTTGMPMRFYIDNYKARAKELAYQLCGNYYYFGHKQYLDKVAILRGLKVDHSLLEKGVYWKKSNRERGLVFSSFHINEVTYELYLKKLREYRPKFIKAYPSSIVAFCYLMKEHKDYGLPNLKGVICSSENIYDWQRQLIKEVLNVEIYSYYGHSEKAVAAFQGFNKRMFFQPLYSFVEFLNKEMKPELSEGAIAQVIVTSFDNNYFPFIRYKTNDYIEVSSYDGKRYRNVAKRIIGREQDFVYDKFGNRVIFTCSDEIFWDIQGVVAYQYIQSERGELKITIQVGENFNSSDLLILQKKAQNIFENFDISISIVENIPKTKMGKFRYLIQNYHFS